MRKFLFLSLLAFAIVSCGDDDPVSSDSFPTDNLNPEPVTNVLIGLVYNSNGSGAGGFDFVRQNIEAKFGKNVNHMSIVSSNGDDLYSTTADSLMDNYGSPPIWTYFLNGEVTNIVSIEDANDAIESIIETKPTMSLAHRVVNTDTGYTVFVKVKVLEDTVSPFYFVETYALANIVAQKYDSGNLDLRQASDNMFLDNNDNNTFWRDNFNPIDSTLPGPLFAKNSAFTHQAVILTNFNKENAFGTNLNTYSKFGSEFFTGDILGLRQNPIVHSFLDEEFEDLDYNYTPKFVSVIWSWDFINQRYTYVNSYMN
jgi:hypothetical protein